MNGLNVTMSAPKRARVEIYGDIGPSWAGMIDTRSVSNAIHGLGEIESIEVRLNSKGGSGFEGLGIASLLKDHPARVEVVIDGVAASAASLIVMAGDSVRIPKNAMLMIHDPVVMIGGREADLQRGIDMLKAMKRASIALYAAKSGKSEKEIAALMTAETWYVGQEAVDAGFADAAETELPLNQAPVKQTLDVQMHLDSLPGLRANHAPLKQSDLEGNMPESPKTPETPAGGQVPATPVVTVPQPDVAKIASEAASQAIADERVRVASILSLCAQAKKPEAARKYLDEGTSVHDVQAALFKLLCDERKPSDDGSQAAGATQAASDPNVAFTAEYKANPHYARIGMSLEDYIATRRIDEGLDKLAPKRS